MTSAIALPGREPRQELGDARRLVVLVVGEQRARDPVPLEQAARVPRVLGEHDVGRAQLGEDAQRDVVEIPDRCRADRERHAQSASNATSAAPISPASAPSSRAHDLELLPAGASASREHGAPRGRQQEVERGDAEAAADDDARRAEDVDERADRDAEVVADLAERRMLLRDEVVRGRVRPEHALRDLVGRASRAVRLDVAAARARALARLAVLDDHHVPELGPARGRAGRPRRRRRRRRCRA